MRINISAPPSLRESECATPPLSGAAVCTLFQQKSCLHTKVHSDTAREFGVVIDCSRERSIVARGNRSYSVVDCHINMSIKCVLCLDSKHRGIMHEGAEIVLSCIGDVLARGSAMGELWANI